MNKITLTGKIIFEVKDMTKKHKSQSSWKKMAMVMFEGDDLCQYYAWFLKKRYGITLNKPLRFSHISFINDSVRDMTQKGTLSQNEVNKIWNDVKNQWNNKFVQITLDLEPQSDGKTWWLNVVDDSMLQGIRDQLGLGKPFYKMHMSIGTANHKNILQSEYILDLIEKGFIQ